MQAKSAVIVLLIVQVAAISGVGAQQPSVSPDTDGMQAKPGFALLRCEEVAGEKVRLRIILVDTRPEAEMVLEKLAGGQQFADLARQYSIDDSTKADGGLIGLVSVGDLRREFQTALVGIGPGGTTAIISTSVSHSVPPRDPPSRDLPPANVLRTGIGNGVRIGNGVTAPSLVTKVEPEYSEKARQAKIEGTVRLKAVVDTAGRARRIQVTQSLGYGLDEKAVEALEQWTFRPGRKDGQPVNVEAAFEINFRLLRSAPVRKVKGAWEVFDKSSKKRLRLRTGMSIAEVQSAARESNTVLLEESSTMMRIGDFVLYFVGDSLQDVGKIPR